MTLIPAGGRFGVVTFVHVLPPSRVRCTRFVLVPTQITPRATADGASDVIDPPAAGEPTPPVPAAAGSGAGEPGGLARSPLTTRHVSPRSFDSSTCCAAIYKVCGSCGENARGGAPPKRSSGVGW